MDEKYQVDVIYTDFEKAFDRFDHDILLQKLSVLGINGNLHRWFTSYIKNRMQAVVTGSARSDFVTIPSGVPQGSILGPLLYNAYLFDIVSCFRHAQHLMFADDKKVFLKIRSIEDCQKLQEDLDALTEYYANNRITVNVKKCHLITLTRKLNLKNFDYKINGVCIPRITTVRDLGIHLDAKLSMNEHIDIVANKAYKQLGFIKRVTHSFNDVNCIKTLYFAYVRSILEYASNIWSPHYIIHTQRIESIQRHFVRYLAFKDFKKFDSYQEACAHYRIDSLEHRREQSDMLLLQAILTGSIDCPSLLSAFSFIVPSLRTRHKRLLDVPKSTTNYAQNSVIPRLARSYNKHYAEVDLFRLPKKLFKKELINCQRKK